MVDHTDLKVPRLIDIQSIYHCLHGYMMVVLGNTRYCVICCVTGNRHSVGGWYIVSVVSISVFVTVVTLDSTAVITIAAVTIVTIALIVFVTIVFVAVAIVHIFIVRLCGYIHQAAVVYISFFFVGELCDNVVVNLHTTLLLSLMWRVLLIMMACVRLIDLAEGIWI